jgi:L-seryl-tRNA(Ser) seleniumtransferase
MLAVKIVEKSELLRKLPSVDEVLRASGSLVEAHGRAAVTEATRTALQRLRAEIDSGSLNQAALDLAISGIGAALERELQRALSFSLVPVINATGVILHTNLGRAPLADSALRHAADIAGVYSNLEFDIETGERGKRDVHADRLFRAVLNFEGLTDLSTIVVNNNAAAVLITLNSLAEGGEVIVSRGELVEIGGSFRIPEVMAKSGALLREVGTTNRTRVADYERAITERTRLLLRVHRSNFEIVGFTEQPSLESLVELGRKRGIPVAEDLGSGALFDLRGIGVHGEPDVFASLRAGVDVVTYSGDKLLGGPQAGLITGRKDLVANIRSNPLFRALRVDKLTYAALEATLLAYVKQDYDAIPALRMMRIPLDAIEARARALISRVGQIRGALRLSLDDGESLLGGGSAPGAALPTKLVAVTSDESTADEIARRLRTGKPPVITRVDEDRVLLDLRTVLPRQDEQVAEALLAISSV